MMNKEFWKDLKGFKGIYKVSNLGRIKSLTRKHSPKENIIKACATEKGYMHIVLYKNKKKKTFRVHRLVASTFNLNVENKPQVNHINGNKKDNRTINLKWSTAKENTNHADRTGLRKIKGEKHYRSKLKNKDVSKIRSMYKTKKFTQRQLGKKFNIPQSAIWYIIKRKTWKHVK